MRAATIETAACTVYLCGLGDLVLSAVAEPQADGEGLRAELVRVADVLSRVNRGAKGS